MAAKANDTVASRIPPPAFYALPLLLLLGVLLRVFFPLKLLPRKPALIVGGVLSALSLALGFSAFSAMRRARTSPIPTHPTKAIVTGGPFRFTRNPIYLAWMLLYAGLALMANALWALLLLPVVMALVHFQVVLREERYLEQKFGEQYLSYKAKVRRWL